MGSRLLPLLVCLLSFSFLLGSCAAALTSKTQFIKSKCGVTSSNPRVYIDRRLAHTAVFVAATHVHSTSRWLSRLLATQRMTETEVVALTDCVELVSNSVRDLRASLREMRRLYGSGRSYRLDDIESRLTAVWTDHDTCITGFINLNIEGEVRDRVSSRIDGDVRLTSKALDLFTRFASDIQPADPPESL